jgi:hypothetical protein
MSEHKKTDYTSTASNTPLSQMDRNVLDEMLDMLRNYQDPLEELGIPKHAQAFCNPNTAKILVDERVGGVGRPLFVVDNVPDGVFYTRPMSQTQMIKSQIMVRTELAERMRAHIDSSMLWGRFSRYVSHAEYSIPGYTSRPVEPKYPEDWRDDPEKRWKYQKRVMGAFVMAPVHLVTALFGAVKRSAP